MILGNQWLEKDENILMKEIMDFSPNNNRVFW